MLEQRGEGPLPISLPHVSSVSLISPCVPHVSLSELWM
jgi:hypothetical protein